jgi:hypothetical protein
MFLHSFCHELFEGEFYFFLHRKGVSAYSLSSATLGELKFSVSVKSISQALCGSPPPPRQKFVIRLLSFAAPQRRVQGYYDDMRVMLSDRALR